MNTQKLTDYLNSLVETGIPSVDCIVYENHKEIYRHMSGHTDADLSNKISGTEQYLMFSMTKIQTMTALMQLVERGIVSLDDEVSKYLPTYANLTVLVDDKVVPVNAPMTIRSLASMQSGLDYDLIRPGIVRVLKEKGNKATTRELVDSFIESPLKFNPGEHFLYSLSHDVIAAVIEVASGMSFSEYLKKNIWEPLNMDNTYFAKPVNEHEANLATQFIVNECGEIVPMEPTCNYQLSDCYESGGAGLISNTVDYSKLGDCLACGGVSADGVRILKAETVELMKQNNLSEAGIHDIDVNMGRRGYGYGCGVQVLMNPELIGSKAPSGVFGWDGAAGSALIMDTASKRSLVYIQHVRNCGRAYGEIHPTLREMLFSE